MYVILVPALLCKSLGTVVQPPLSTHHLVTLLVGEKLCPGFGDNRTYGTPSVTKIGKLGN